LNEADGVHVRLKEPCDRDRHAAEQGREYDNGSDIFFLRCLDSKNLSLWLAQATRNGAHSAMKNQFIIDYPPGNVFNCHRAGDCGRVDCDCRPLSARPTASEPKNPIVFSGCRGAEQRDELTPGAHSITSSARC
jgi:hypothetical protein